MASRLTQTMHQHLHIALEGLDLPEAAPALLGKHWDLLMRWNARTNLTALTDPLDAAWLHYRDSLVVLDLIDGATVDMGSGGGFPGIPIAIARPEFQFTLVEPRRKRVSFLRTCVAELALKNVSVVMGRSTDAPNRQYRHVVTRATFSQVDDLTACRVWLEPGGTLIALRSADAPSEPAMLPDHVQPYSLRDERREIHIWKSSAN